MRSRRLRPVVPIVASAALVACGSAPDEVSVPGAADRSRAPTSAATTTSTPVPAGSDDVDGDGGPPETDGAATTVATTEPPATTVPPTEPSTTPVAPTEPPVTTVEAVYYRAGDEDPAIATIQEKLVALGYLDAGGYVPERFDGATNDAVLAFQGDYGVLVDGVVGPETRRALSAAAASVDAAGT